MSCLLVSFPNVFPYGFALAAYDFDSGDFRWIDLAEGDRPLLGVDGICRRGDGYWTLPQWDFGGVSGLGRLDLDLRPTRCYPLTQTRDAHSLIADGEGFLVTDTGRNRLNIVRVGQHGQVHEEEFWRACQGDQDLVHLNSVARLDGDLYVSHLGPRPEEGWSHAEGGRIVNITRNQVVCDNLRHPHTLVPRDGVLYWLESGRSRVHRYSPRDGHEVLLELHGYLRGMTFDQRCMYVGASALRRRSRSTGATNVYPSATADDWHSWIHRVDRTTLEVVRRKMTVFGEEIYDLMRVEPAVAGLQGSDREKAVVDRMWKYEDTYWDRVALHKEQVQNWENELAVSKETASYLQEQVAYWQRQVSELAKQASVLRKEASDSQGQAANLRAELASVYSCRGWRWARRVLSPFQRLGLLPRRPAQREPVSTVQ